MRRAALVDPVSSAACSSSPGMSDCSVAKCCSASVSVGAMSAACAPCSTARSIAYRATTVFPDPTSPISRRCIGRPAARSSSIAAIAARWSSVGVNGSDVSSQRAVSDGASASASARADSRRRARRRSSVELHEQQLLEREPQPARLLPAEVRGAERRRAVGPAAGGAQPRRQGLDDVGQRAAVLAHQGGDLRRRQPVGRRVGGDVALGPDLVGRLGVELDPEAVAALVLALQHQPRPRG